MRERDREGLAGGRERVERAERAENRGMLLSNQYHPGQLCAGLVHTHHFNMLNMRQISNNTSLLEIINGVL